MPIHETMHSIHLNKSIKENATPETAYKDGGYSFSIKRRKSFCTIKSIGQLTVRLHEEERVVAIATVAAADVSMAV